RRSRPTSYIAPTARAPSSSPKAAPSSPPTTSGPLRKFMWRLAGQRRLSRRCSSSKAGERIPSSSRLASDAADSAIHPHDSRNGPLAVAAFDEIARAETELEGQALTHLQRLVTSWGLLADLCFADLLLFAPLDEE